MGDAPLVTWSERPLHGDDFRVRYWGEQWEGGSNAVWTKNRGESDTKRNQVSFQPTLISFG